jgi:V-type H+-transporting ATPase subunit F
MATGKLIGVIGDEDTVTGFLLAGVGARDVSGANFVR